MLTVAACLAAVSACSHTDPPAIVKVVAPTLPASAETPCAKPVTLPARDLTELEVASAWGRDRASLMVCEARRAAAVAAIKVGAPK